MAFHRKIGLIQQTRPDILVISECANPSILIERGITCFDIENVVWMGSNKNKGLAIFAFNGFGVQRYEPFFPTLRYILPARIVGPTRFNLIAVWAQNASAGITRKNQMGPLRRGLTNYRKLLDSGPTVIGGDWNSNAIWDKPGWKINHMTKVRQLGEHGLKSVYHETTGQRYGEETEPTLYWRDRRKDGKTYHLDYVFIPETWFSKIHQFSIGSFEDWVEPGYSDHVPIVLELDL
ncbi:MAG: hypothetical protein AAGE61_03435 [Pseudomonadota bacterium]